MLVHPDKNMGNEKAVEAFKKLQNAYEVNLLVSIAKIFFFFLGSMADPENLRLRLCCCCCLFFISDYNAKYIYIYI